MNSVSRLFPCYFSLATLLLVQLLQTADAGRFAVTGPVLTVTLKDPDSQSEGKWLDLSSFRPNLVWSVQSQGSSKPLPQWLPSLQSIRGTIGYQYNEKCKHLPSFIEGDMQFFKRGVGLEIQPSYEIQSQRSTWLVQLSKGTAYVMAKLSSTGDRWLEMVRGCYQADLPYASVGGVRITPQWDFRRGEPSCLMEGTTGSQRTKAVLNLEYQNPTLSVVHALDERHVIAPEISLYNAKIIYQWNIALQSGSIRTKVDPTSDIHVTWTDKSMTGKWVTDFRLPLAGTTISALAADVRVRRQFSF